MANAAMSAGIMFQTLGDQIGGTMGKMLGTASQAMYMVMAFGYIKAILPILRAEFWKSTMTIGTTEVALWKVALAGGAAFGAFAIAMQVFRGLDTPILILITVLAALAAILWAVFIAESAVTWGIAAAIGGVAAAGAATIASRYTSHAMGTRMVGATGPAILHQGEVVYNPSTGRPTQIGNDLQGGGGRTVVYEQPINIEEVNTKADVDDLDEKLRKSLRKSAHGRR
jgi:hypothetical protein